ncbi:hypothetical protein JTB14_018094 [Gonioctena quinquepunctata]|nr:hypothetical protein JTB14_018094 [Gonioctena quinquepunctata]
MKKNSYWKRLLEKLRARRGNKGTQTNAERQQKPTTQDEEVHKVMHIREAEGTPNYRKVNIQQGIKEKGVIILEHTILEHVEEKTMKKKSENFEQFFPSTKNFSSNKDQYAQNSELRKLNNDGLEQKTTGNGIFELLTNRMDYRDTGNRGRNRRSFSVMYIGRQREGIIG